MTLKKSLYLLFLTSFVLVNNAYAAAEKLKFKMSSDRVLAVEIIRAKNPKLPTFLFLPGVNRGLLSTDESIETLTKKGFGAVTFNFSVQPISVAQLDKQVRPAFMSKSYSLDELGSEVTALSAELKKNYGVKIVVPVSISFSSAVSSTLQNFPFIIDVVPMSSSAAVNPELENYITTLKGGEIFNPIFGPAITRSVLDQAYYAKWRDQVDSLIDQFNLNTDHKSEMVEGYTVLSRASERFVWDLKKTSKETRRVFMFARNDDEGLLKNQLELFLKAMDTTPNALAFIVNNSGHVLPDDQPKAYALIIASVTNGTMKDTSGIVEFDPETSKMKLYKAEEAKKYLNNLIDLL